MFGVFWAASLPKTPLRDGFPLSKTPVKSETPLVCHPPRVCYNLTPMLCRTGVNPHMPNNPSFTRRVRRARPALPALTLALLIVLLALPAAAQAPALTITQADLRLWPEYDDPGLLVIFAGTFAETTGFPQEIAIPIPANARNVQAAYLDASGGLLMAEWKIANGKLVFSPPAPQFHIEYYVDRTPSGDERTITHTLEAPYPIQTLSVTVQQPARASEFSVTPQAEQSLVGDDGLTYYTFNRANLAAGEKLDIQVRYTKTDSGLSKPQLAIPSTTPSTPASAPVSPKPTNWLPWLLIGLGGVILFAAAGYWLWTRRKPQPAPLPSRKPASAASAAPRPAAGMPAGQAAAAFCTQCGRPLRPEDRFCSQCGAPRRG